MLTKVETTEIVRILEGLPPEQVAEVRDFALFLHERYGAETLTAAQQEELTRRLADLEENPEDELPWEAVKAELEAAR